MKKCFVNLAAVLIVLCFVGTAFANGNIPVTPTTNNAYSKSKSSADADAKSKSSVDNSGLNISGNDLREFVEPAIHSYPNLPTENLVDQQYANIQKVGNIVNITNRFSKFQLNSMKGGSVKILEDVNLNGETTDNQVDIIFITSEYLIENHENTNLKKLGSIIAKGDINTTTGQVLSVIGLKALNIKGATHVLIQGEGRGLYTKVSGWGVALGYTHAYIANDQTQSGVGAAGVGYSSGKAERLALPFIQGTVLAVENKVSLPKKFSAMKTVTISEPVIHLEDVHFDFDQYSLKPEAKELLNKHIKRLKFYKDDKILIEGHTSMSGSYAYNQKLSERRASSVQNYLVKNGIEQNRLTTIGYGKTKPAVHEVNPKDINSKSAKANMRVLFEISVK